MTTATKRIGPDDLIADGFKPWTVPVFKRADYFWQKRIRDDDGQTLYFVNAYGYDWKRYAQQGLDRHPDAPAFTVEFDLQVYTDPERRGFISTTYSPAPDATLKPVLMFLHRLWETMSGVPCEGGE